jgi:hypothetical protein
VGTFKPVFNKGDYNEAFVAKYDTLGHLVWGTYFGGTNAYINDTLKYSHLNIKSQIAMDNDGNIFLVGYTTDSVGIATANSFQPNFSAGTSIITGYMAKFNNNGQLQWSSYFPELILGIACDANGDFYITGNSSKSTGIATANSFKPTLSSGLCQGFITGDAFLVKFNTNGQRLWGTYYGGSLNDEGTCIGVLPNNDVIMGGATTSSDQIATPGAHQTNSGPTNCMQGKSFIARFTSNGQRLWGTYYCDTTSLVSNNHPMKIYCDKNGTSFYMAGYTHDTSGIATANSFKTFNSGNGDLYLAKFTNDGQLSWGTYYGGSGLEDLVIGNDFNANMDWPRISLGANDAGEIFMSSASTSHNYVTTDCSYKPVDTSYGFMAKFTPQGQRLWGSYTDANASGVTLALGAGKSFYVSVSTRVDGKATIEAPKTIKISGHMAGLMAKFEDAFICAERNIIIQVNDSILRVDSGFATYKWYKNGVLQTNQNGAVFHLDDSADYYVIVTDSCGCIYTSNVVTAHSNTPPVTGIRELSNGGYTLFPNPNNGIFTVQFSRLNTVINKGFIEVTNMVGTMVYQSNFNANILSAQRSFNLSFLLPGAYIIKVKCGDANGVFKMIKQ